MNLLINSDDKVVGIYCIKNVVTGKMYIGSSINIEGRWKQHRYQLNTNRHENHYLQHSWNKHGEGSFEFSILEVVDLTKKLEILSNVNSGSLHKRVINLIESDDDRDILYGINLAREQYYLDKSLSEGCELYNICYSAVGGNHDEMTRKRISVAMTGRTSFMKGKKRDDISGENNVHYDDTVRRFVNIKTGEIYEGTKYNFAKHIDVPSCYMSGFLKGKYYVIKKEWIIEGTKLERKSGSGRKKMLISEEVYKFTCIDSGDIIESKYYELGIPNGVFKKMLSGNVIKHRKYTLLSKVEYDNIMINRRLKNVARLNEIRPKFKNGYDRELFLNKLNKRCKRYNFLNIKTGEIFNGTTIEFKRKYNLYKFNTHRKLASCGWTIKFNSVDEYNVELLKGKKSGTIKMRNTLHGGNHPSMDHTVYELINLITWEEFNGRKYDFKMKYNYVGDNIKKIFNKKSSSYDGWILKCNLNKYINKPIYKIVELKNIKTDEIYNCNFHQFMNRFNIDDKEYSRVYRFFNNKFKLYNDWVFSENYDSVMSDSNKDVVRFDIKNIKTSEIINITCDNFCKRYNHRIGKTYTFFVTKKTILFDDQWVLAENEHLLNDRRGGKDYNKYIFKNKVTGEIFEGTRSELRKKYKNLTILGLYRLITNRVNSYCKWIICK
jgi:group I intron endonuclease